MRPETIFAPVSVLALWTGVVLLLTGSRRIRALRAGRVRTEAFRLGESSEVPPDVAVANRNLMNLLEMPVLFYVVCVVSYVTQVVTGRVVALAWIYVGLRVLHSLLHVTTNRLPPRTAVFAVSNVVLLALWVRFVRTLVSHNAFW
jgi:hypothetical protein